MSTKVRVICADDSTFFTELAADERLEITEDGKLQFTQGELAPIKVELPARAVRIEVPE